MKDEYVGHRVDDDEYCPSFGEPSFSAWLQFQNVSLVFLRRHEYKYANTEIYIDSDIAVRIFVLDTPAECTLTSLRDVWLREVLKLHWLCVRINLKPLASSQNFSTLHCRAYGEFLLVSECAESRICLVSGA